MDTNKTVTTQQGCIIMVMFPVVSDEQTLSIKHQIDALLANIPDSRIDFRITTIPVTPPRAL